MKAFLITFLVSTAITVLLWQFGLGSRLWPDHPFLASLGGAVVGGVAVQVLLSRTSTDQK